MRFISPLEKVASDMEFTDPSFLTEWEERWRREKERRKRVMEEGGEGIERVNQELRRIVEFNDSRMGLAGVTGGSEGAEAKICAGVLGWHLSDESCMGESVYKCQSKTFHGGFFETLREFRDLSLLTDLTLTGDDGSIFHVHSLTLAAVSLLVQEKLMGKSRNSSDFGLQRWSIDLGASVNQVGLQAVVEFAYSGDVPSMNESIQTAAEVLKVVHLLDLCTKENDMRQPALMVTLQSIHQLWEDRVGCDVVLDVGGTFLHG